MNLKSRERNMVSVNTCEHDLVLNYSESHLLKVEYCFWGLRGSSPRGEGKADRARLTAVKNGPAK